MQQILEKKEIAKEEINKVYPEDIVDGVFNKNFNFTKSFLLKDDETVDVLCSIVSINYGAFRDLTNLVEVSNLYGCDVSIECFSGCINLQKISLDNVHKINDLAFSDCISLKNVSMPDVEEFGKEVFKNCKSLESVAISPKAIDNLFNSYKNDKKSWKDNNIFVGCDNLKKIYISTGAQNISEWEDDLKSKKKFPSFFSPKEHYLKRIRKMFGDVEVSFLKNSVIFKDENVDKKSDEISVLVAKIKNLCGKLPDDSRLHIINKVDNLLNTYNEDVRKAKPVYGEKRSGLILSDKKDVSLLRTNLLSHLNYIYYTLSHEKSIIDDISLFDGYLKMIQDDKVVNLLNNGNSLGDKISQVLYYANFLEDDKKKEVVLKLYGFVNDALNKCNDLLSSVNDASFKLSLDNSFNYSINLRKNIDDLFDDVKLRTKDVIPFRRLKNSFLSHVECEDGDKILEFIDMIRYGLEKIEDNYSKKDLENDLRKIFDKYSLEIDDILKVGKEINYNNYNNLVVRLRKDLTPFLLQLNQYAYSYELGNSMDLLEQIRKSVEIINGKEKFDKESEDYKNQVIISFVIDILNKLGSVYDYETIIKIKEDLLKVISKWSDELSSSSSFDYVVTSQKILGDLASVSIKIDEYLKEDNEYNKYVR